MSEDASSITFSHAGTVAPAAANTQSSPGTVGGQTVISSDSSYAVVTPTPPRLTVEDVENAGNETPTRGTRRKAIEDDRVDSPTPPKSPRALLELEDSAMAIVAAMGIGGSQPEGVLPSAITGGEEPSPISNVEERMLNTMEVLRAEVAQQESRVLQSERARQESTQYIEQIAYDEISAMQANIMQRDAQIRQQLEMIRGQGHTIEEMTIEDEGATYRCEELERMNHMAQEVAAHLKNRVLSINEEYNVQGINAEQMYHEAHSEISSLRRSLEALNQRYMVAQSELNVASSSAEEVARQHAKELFNKDMEKQETVRQYYHQESTQQGIIIDLQQKLLNEESSLQIAQQRIHDRRHEVHDVQLELHEALEHKQKCESQLAVFHKMKERLDQHPLVAKELIDKSFPTLACEINDMKAAIAERDEKLRRQGVIMDQYARDDADRALSNDGNESMLRMQQLIDKQGGQLEKMSKHMRDVEEYNKDLVSKLQTMREYQGPNLSVDMGKVQDMKEAFEKRIYEMDGRMKILGTDYTRKVKMIDECRQHEKAREQEMTEAKAEIKRLKDENTASSWVPTNPWVPSTSHVPSTTPVAKASSSILTNVEAAEIARLRRDLEDMEARKERYKDWWKQSEDYANEEQEESQRLRSEFNESKAEASSSTTSSHKGEKLREADKIVVPPWPSVAGLKAWKTRVITNLFVACGDRDQKAWGDWISEAMIDNPDMDKLARIAEPRFQSMDAKLSIALNGMLDNAGELANDVKQKLNLRTLETGASYDYVKGREILAMILSSFKTTTHAEVMYNAYHLHVLQYPGDNKIREFYSKWQEMLANIKPSDMPSKESLRDILHRKLDNSTTLMKIDMNTYDNKREGDPDKSLEYLTNMMVRHIEKGQEKMLLQQRDKAMSSFTSFSDRKATPVEPDPSPKEKKKPKPKAEPKHRAATPAKNRDMTPDPHAAASVLPSPNPKQHAKGKSKGKKGGGRDRTKSPSRERKDPKKIPCMFHFEKGGCKRGAECKYSHSQSVFDSNKSKRQNSRSKSPGGDKRGRARSSTPGPNARKGDCYLFLNGYCPHGKQCKFQHAKPSSPAAKQPSKPATPVVTDDFFASDDESYVTHAYAAAGKVRDKKQVRFSKSKPETLRYTCPDLVDNMPSSQTKNGKGKHQKAVTTEDLLEVGYKRQISLNQVIARAKGMLMDMSDNMQNLREVRIILFSNTDTVTFYRITRDVNPDIIAFQETTEQVRRTQCWACEPDVLCLTVPILEKDRRFILDSGSGHDLISQKKAQRMELDTFACDEICFHTANGTTSTTTQATIDMGTFTKKPQAYVLQDSPSVMSLGKRCQDEGYSFIWPTARAPYLIAPNGRKIQLIVRDYIPYISLGAPECEPINDPEARKIMHLLASPVMQTISSTDKSVLYISEESGDESEELLPDNVDSIVLSRRRKLHPKVRRKYAPKASPTQIDEESRAVARELDIDIDDGPGGVAPPPAEPPDDEDDDAVLEVDIVDGDTRLARRGTLKHEAKTIVHLLTHRFKNPYCESCVRAKMKHFKTKRGAFKRSLKKFGDLITFDIVDSKQTVLDEGVALEKEVFIIRDRFSGMIGAYPSKSIDHASVIKAVKQFIGQRKISMAYSDKAPQFESAFKEMKITLDHSVPGRSQTNSLAERNNQFVLSTTTTCLLQAGLPPCFWRKAIECVCQLLNVEPGDDDVSAWCKVHGKEFPGEKIPFGALVFFKPSGARKVDQDHKFDPKAIPGVFAGYNLGSGHHWNRQYLCWELTDFADQNLSYDTRKPKKALLRPHITEKVVMQQPLTFPLKEMYEYMNVSLEGLREKERLDGEPIYLDDIDDDDDDDSKPDDDEKPDQDQQKLGGEGGSKLQELIDRINQPDYDKYRNAVDDDDYVPSELDELPDHSAVDEELKDKDQEPSSSHSGKKYESYEKGKPGDGIIYEDMWGDPCKIDSKGRTYKVGEDGRRLLKPSLRPKEITPEDWQRLPLADRERLKHQEKKIRESKAAEERAARKLREAKRAEEADAKKAEKDQEDKDDPKDVSPIILKQRPHLTLPLQCESIDLDMYEPLEWKKGVGKRYIDCRKKGLDNSPNSVASASTTVPDDEEYLTEWDEWSEIELGKGAKASWKGNIWNMKDGSFSKTKIMDGRSVPIGAAKGGVEKRHGEVVWTSSVDGSVDECVYKCDPSDDSLLEFPTMPCTPCETSQHRDHIESSSFSSARLFNAMVSRPVGRAEIESNPKAKEAMKKEWRGLHDQEVFDFTVVREYDDVVAEAKRNSTEIHMARVHGICVEKNYQLPEGNPSRKFKGRGVLLGNQVKNQHWEAAFFQDLGNSPASFEAARWADFFGCLPGNDVKLADAIQAYIQAKLTGPACWVELPTDAWPDQIEYWKFRRPVVRLDKALYGHPDSGTMWEKHCDTSVRELDFIPVGEEWPSMYYHPKLQLMLVIYVDDLKLAGPAENLTKGWEMLRTKLRIEPETDLGLYLGCILSKGESKMYDGSKVKTLTYNMEGLLRLSVEKYLEIIGKDTKLKRVSTPSLPEDTKESQYRAPISGKKGIECPWCMHQFDPDTPDPYRSGTSSDGTSLDESNPRGTLAPHAASVLMKLLYAARIARFDLLRSINSLARNVTKWSTSDDAKLHHLMCYVNSTLSMKMIGWVGDNIKDLSLALYADADFAGCAQSLRSTSGSHLHVQGKHTRFPLAGGSKRQGCVSHSTPEAEIVAADTALRTLGIPAISIWRIIANRYPQLLFHDDNQGMIGVVRSGRNPTMRHMERTHGISIASLHEHFKRDHFVLIYEITAKMAADIHTKGFKNPLAWKRACMLINLLEPDDLASKDLFDLVQPSTDVDTTTRQVFQSKTADVPNFPYTETPVLPPDVYVKGLTSKLGYQHVSGSDPIFVVKAPVFYRTKPPGVPLPMGLNRSTWILVNGVWSQVEDNVAPPAQAERFEQWVERACFQWHSPDGKVIPIVCSPRVSDAIPLGSHRAPQAVPSNVLERRDPQLQFSTEELFSDKGLHHHYTSLADLTVPCGRVINTLVRLVHGGSHGTGLRSDTRSRRYPTATNMAIERTQNCDQSDIEDEIISHEVKTRKEARIQQTNDDTWEWEDEETLVRKHQTPRRSRFSPQECETCPCDIRKLSDKRQTSQIFRNQRMDINDNWRMKGDYSKGVTNKKNEFWVGKTTFKVMAHDSIGLKKNLRSGGKNNVTLCTGCKGMKILSQEHVFVVHRIRAETCAIRYDEPQLKLTLLTNDGNEFIYRFTRSIEDQKMSNYGNLDIHITLAELPKHTPALVLLCSEERNWFTQLASHHRKYKFHVVTITEDDDLLSSYGHCKVKACLRTSADTSFFSGPCTGGSPWNRLNKWMRQSTVHMLEAKQKVFWRLWRAFTDLLVHALLIGAPALMELPRGCDYWHDKRMTDLLGGTEHVVHSFDGCMYGLKSSYSAKPLPIKKPWKIVSWNIDFPELHLTCDRSHEHVECAGRETKQTQTYTPQIVTIIMNRVNKHVKGDQYLTDLKYEALSRYEEHPNESRRKAKDFSDYRSRSSSSSNGYRPVACAIFEDCVVEEELRVLLRLLAVRCVPGGSPQFGHRPFEALPGKALSVWTTPSVVSAGTCFCHRLSWLLNDNTMGQILAGLAGLNVRKRVQRFCEAIRDFPEGGVAPHGLVTIERKDSRVGIRELTEDQADAWMLNGCPPILAAAAYFESSREKPEHVEEFLVAWRLIGEHASEDELKKGTSSYLTQCRTILGLFIQYDYDAYRIDRFCSRDIHSSLGNLLDLVKTHYQPVPFHPESTMREVFTYIDRKLSIRGASRHVRTDPAIDSYVARTRTATFRNFFEETSQRLPSQYDPELTRMMCRRAVMEARFMAHALRLHNKIQTDASKKIKINTIMIDIADFEIGASDRSRTTLENQSMELRCAAQNHLTLMLSMMYYLYIVRDHWLDERKRARDYTRMVEIDEIVQPILDMKVELSAMLMNQIPEDLIDRGGYHIPQAEDGDFEQVKRRFETQSRMRDHATSLSSAQAGGTFSASDCPILEFGDTNLPDELDDLGHRLWPEWTEERRNEERRIMEEERRREERKEEEERKRKEDERKERASGSIPTKARPTSAPPPTMMKEWGRIRLGPTVSVKAISAFDYSGTQVRCEVLKSGDYFIPFNLEGVVALTQQAKRPWIQYLRRLTHYSSIVMGTASNTALAELDDADNIEWLKMYTHNFNLTCMKSANVFLSPEALMIRLGMCDPALTAGEIPGLIKKLSSKIGTYIIERPLQLDADKELCGALRAAPTVIVTDLVYHTRSNSNSYNIEAGLMHTMNNTDTKVFQVDWDKMRNAESTLKIFENAAGHVANIARIGGQSPYVHIWLSFTAMIREGSPLLMEEAGFLDKIAEYIGKIQQKVGIPVFTLLLMDGKFHDSEADLKIPAMKVQEDLTKMGILCSTNGMLWRGAYSLVGRNMYSWIKDFGTRDSIWAHLDKHLLRQKMMLACALDWKVVPILNGLAIQYDKNGLNQELVKKCTGAPSIRTAGSIYSSSVGERQKGDAGGNVAAELLEKRTMWSDIQFNSHIPNPVATADEYWVERAPNSGLECGECSTTAVNDLKFWENEKCCRSCCNCAANTTLRAGIVAAGYEGMDRSDKEIKWLAELAARLKILCRNEKRWYEKVARDNMLEFMIAAARYMKTDYGDGMTEIKKDMLKQISHYGGIRVASHLVPNIIKQGHVAAFTTRRQIIKTKEGHFRAFYQLLYDGGNVAYADYVRQILSEDDFIEVCGGHANVSAEGVGDIFEFWLGMFYTASIFPDIMEWGPDMGECLRGLEESFYLYVASSRGSRTVNSKIRNRAEAKEWPPERENKVMNILEELEIFQRIANGKITLMDFIPSDNTAHVIEVDDDDDDDIDEFVYVDEEGEEETQEHDVEMSPGEPANENVTPEEAEERLTKKRKVSEMFDAAAEAADVECICLVCGSTDHITDLCVDDDAEGVKEMLKKIKEKLQVAQPQPKPATPPKKSGETSGGKVGGKTAKNQVQGKDIFTKFDRPTPMPEIGDQEEGGKYLVGKMDIGTYGPKNKDEMGELIELALERSKTTILPEISQLLDDKYESINKGHPGYAKIDVKLSTLEKEDADLCKIFSVDIVPLMGCEFCMYPWNMSCLMSEEECRRRTTEYEDLVSRRFGARMRHGIGAKTVPITSDPDGLKGPGLKCDEGYWANIEDALGDDRVFKTQPVTNAHDRWWYHFDRLRKIVKITQKEYYLKKRVRFEILALTAIRIDLAKHKKFAKDNGIDLGKIISKDPVLGDLHNIDKVFLKPIAVRATMAHKGPKDSIQFQPWRASLQINRQCALQLGGAYHTTTLANLTGIMRHGLIPGGGGDRMTSFMLPFGPWDQRSETLVKRAKTFGGESRVCLFFGAETMETFKCRITSDGNIVTQMVIPFSHVEAVWADLASPIEPWVRLLVRTEKTHVISSVKGCTKIASVEKGVQMLKTVSAEASGGHEEFKKELIKIRDAHVTGHRLLVPETTEWNDMASLMAVCYMSNEANHILCPGCLEETPRCISICLNCQGTLVSHGTIKKIRKQVTEGQTGKSVPKASEAKAEPADDDVKMEQDEPEEIFPDVPANDDNAGDEEDDPMGQKEPGRPEGYDENIQEEADAEEASSSTRFVFADGSTAENVALAIPKWLAKWDYGVVEMAVEPAKSLDPYPRAPEMIDHLIGQWITDAYNVFIGKFVIRTQIATSAQLIANRQGNNPIREDMHGRWPDCGEDENGEMRDPTREEMKRFHELNHLNVKGKNRDYARDDLDDFTLAFQGMKTLCKIMQYLINAGWAINDIKHELHSSAESQETILTNRGGKLEWESEQYAKWRENAWTDLQRQSKFVRRAIRGAFRAHSYTYFRPEVDYEGTVFLNPMALLLAVKKEYRRTSVLYVCRNYQVKLNKVLSDQLDKQINKAKENPDKAPEWGTHMQEDLVKSICDAGPGHR